MSPRFTEQERTALQKRAQLLKAEDLTRKEISERIGVAQGTVANWLTGVGTNAWSRRRLRRVSLAEVPQRVRLKAARDILQEEADDVDRIEILLAAWFPSTKRYWVVDLRSEQMAA